MADHLTVEELKHRYLQAKDPVEARRYLLLWLVKEKRYSLKKAAGLIGLNYDYSQEILRGYNQQGPKALRNRRRDQVKSGGRPALLSPEQMEQLRKLIESPPPDGGLWSGPKVARWIAQVTGREQVRPQRGWDYLKRCGYSWQRPRPRHRKADVEAQEAFKKTS